MLAFSFPSVAIIFLMKLRSGGMTQERRFFEKPWGNCATAECGSPERPQRFLLLSRRLRVEAPHGPRPASQHSSEKQSLPRNSVASSSTLDRNRLSFLRQL